MGAGVVNGLVERAVEAAARAEAAKSRNPELWNEASAPRIRDAVRPVVLAALGVVADHCTTEAALADKDADAGGVWRPEARTRAHTLFEVAAELRETPE